jgi:hypothetical protein
MNRAMCFPTARSVMLSRMICRARQAARSNRAASSRVSQSVRGIGLWWKPASA